MHSPHITHEDLDQYQSLANAIALLAMTEPLIQDQRSLVSSIEANLRMEHQKMQSKDDSTDPPHHQGPNDRHPHGNHRLSGSWLSFLLPSFISGMNTDKVSPYPSPRSSMELHRKRAARISDILVSAKERLEELESKKHQLVEQRTEVLSLFENAFHNDPKDLDDRCVIDEISLAIIQAQSELSSLSTPSVSPLDERSDRIITLRTTITSLENQAREAFWTMNERRVELFEKELEVSGKGRTGVEPLIIVGDFRGVGVWQEMADGIDR